MTEGVQPVTPLLSERALLRDARNAMIGRWFPIVGNYFGGQVAAQVLNVATALLLVRMLPIREYALYVLANLLITVGSVGSDLGLSSAVTTFGSRLLGDPGSLGRLYASALRLRRWLFLLTTAALILLAPVLMGGHGWPLTGVLVCLLCVLANNWVQQTNGLRTAVFNIYHDSRGLAAASVGAGLVRLGLTVIICRVAPFASIALLINVTGSILSNHVLGRRGRKYLNLSEPEDPEHTKRLRRFVYPLVGRTVYFIFQGQIALLLIGYFGAARSIAEVGALGRLNQVMTVLVGFNSFLFHPSFARARSRASFVRRLALAAGGVCTVMALILWSAFFAPQLWLAVLGPKYHSLSSELPFAVGGAVAEYVGEFLFIVLLSRAYTQKQWLYIAITMAVQLLFVVMIGADTTHKVMLLNLANRLAIVLVQGALVLNLIRRWKEPSKEEIPGMPLVAL